MTARVPVLADVIFPDRIIAQGVAGKNSRVNERTRSQGGNPIVDEVRGTLREYTAGLIPLSIADWALMEGLHEITGGGAYGMLLKDPKDQIVTAGAGMLRGFAGGQLVGTAGQGYGVPIVKMFQRKTAQGTSRFFDRRITRPQAGAAILRNGAPPPNSGPGSVTIDTTTGMVTFVADASQVIASITVGATTVLNFANGSGIVAAMAVNERVYLSGIGGTTGARLNGLSHQVTAKGATSLTIATTTTGLTGTGGTAAKYPQATDLLTWSGLFFVPVQFRDDEIDWTIENGGPFDTRLTTGPAVVLIEIPEA